MTDYLREREHASEDLTEILAERRRLILVRAVIVRGIVLRLGQRRRFRSFALFIRRCVLGSLGQRSSRWTRFFNRRLDAFISRAGRRRRPIRANPRPRSVP